MKPAAAIILIAGLSTTTAHAVETGTLTLACKGTTVFGPPDANPEPVSMGLIVNFTAETIQGFSNPDLPGNISIKITGINEVIVAFGGFGQSLGSNSSMMGTIDRVTGDVEARHLLTEAKTGKLISSLSYSLKCRPTQRMF